MKLLLFNKLLLTIIRSERPLRENNKKFKVITTQRIILLIYFQFTMKII